jgi:hypothetical protein
LFRTIPKYDFIFLLQLRMSRNHHGLDLLRIVTVRYFSLISEIEHDYGLMARPAVRVGNGRADRGGACRGGWREKTHDRVPGALRPPNQRNEETGR